MGGGGGAGGGGNFFFPRVEVDLVEGRRGKVSVFGTKKHPLAS